MKPNFDALVAKVGALLPRRLLKPLVRFTVGENQVALCLHRVSASRRPTDWQPYLTISPDELDALIELLLASRPDDQSRWLTVTFDDGYEDAAEYVASRAERYPSVEFLFFVCPEKTEKQTGFRWDLVEEALRSGKPLSQAATALNGEVDVEKENAREELKRVAQEPSYRLAEAKRLKELQKFENVLLGNHTNCHIKQTELTEEQAKTEYERSKAVFDRLFGEQRHFAFPFGTPNWEFNETHVRLLRGQGDFLLWTTERRPYAPNERGPSAVLPRFPVNGTWNHRAIATWIAARSLIFRVRGTQHRFDRR
jgi:peptidoglycan/xylan/chitin deacetylase (PgdA/CDA1 family)